MRPVEDLALTQRSNGASGDRPLVVSLEQYGNASCVARKQICLLPRDLLIGSSERCLSNYVR
jgi:hypothetical protein